MIIYQEDCIDNEKKIKDDSVHLGIYDPPFGIGETDFDKHYKRNTSNVIQGYKEAPKDYEQWTLLWMAEAKRVLNENGSMYVIMGHSNLRHILNAAHNLDLYEINHLIWKYNFGVNTKKKYVTSHYHILHYSKSKNAKITFNVNCRFGSQEKDENGRSLLYKDLEDVFVINKEYAPNQQKNQNKLPKELISKLILYSSNEGDMVCDFFMGNFTTAYVALGLGRDVCGYEINKNSFDYHMEQLKKIDIGCDLKNIKKVKNIVPLNQGKRIDPTEVVAICEDYLKWHEQKMLKKDIIMKLQGKYGRGPFAIKNILEKHLQTDTLVKK